MKAIKTLFAVMGLLTAASAAYAQDPPAEHKTVTTISYGACTQAQLNACRRQDPYGSGCMIENGHPVCLFF